MPTEKLYNELLSIVGEAYIKQNEPMKYHTSFKIGGPADIFIMPRNDEQLLKSIATIKKHHLPYYVIGNGSNLLVKDGGIRGCVIKLNKQFSDITVNMQQHTVYAMAGATTTDLAAFCVRHHLTGAEFACGIPGTIGGTVFMNAGAYSHDMSDIVTKVKMLDPKGDVVWKNAEEMNFGYRTSYAMEHYMIILGAVLQLKYDEKAGIGKEVERLTDKRKNMQPLEYPSAGSAFKRPEGHYAAKLIDDCKLKGYKLGDAQVSTKHAGFIVNTGNATSSDVINLIQHIQKTVKDTYDVDLYPEIRIIGEDVI